LALPRAARERAAEHQAAAGADAFAAMLIAALDRPDVRKAVVSALAGHESRRPHRNPPASAAAARDLKARLVTGGRGSRG